MTEPFATTRHRLGEHSPVRYPAPVLRAESPVHGTVWVVTSEELAREVLGDPRVSKDPADAPTHWPPWLHAEPPAAERPSLTTLDGPEHLRLRRAHAPLFTARRLRAHTGEIKSTARNLLRATGTDLAADFTTRYPLAVICGVLGVPDRLLDEVTAACGLMMSGGPERIMAGMTELIRLVGSALNEPDSAASELSGRLDLTADEIAYLLFGLVFAGQVTTASALGFLIAHHLAGHQGEAGDERFVQDVLRRHPPAPFTLWRFTTEELRLGDELLPPRSPVLVHIEGINDTGHDLTFGAGPHHCVGAQLAQLELVALVQVLRADFPNARLAVPFDELPVRREGIQAAGLTELPVHLE